MASRQRPGHPPEATGGLPGGSVDLHKILTMPPHGRPPVPPCPALGPALAGTVASRQNPIPSGKAQFHRRGKAHIPSCTPPPGGFPAARRAFVKFYDSPARAASQFHRAQPLWARSRAGKALFRRAKPNSTVVAKPYSVVHPASWKPPGGSESLRKILTMPPHGRRASSTCPSPCGHGHWSGNAPILSGNAPTVPSPCGRVARPLWRPCAGGWGHGGIGSPPVRGHRQNS